MYINMGGRHWNIASARRRFAELVKSAAREPQALYNRGEVVAGVVDAEELREFQAWKAQQQWRSVADAFDELRALCEAESYELVVAERVDRVNPFDDGVSG